MRRARSASIFQASRFSRRLPLTFISFISQKGALATTAIEGNTLSEAEVVKHLEGKLRLPPSKQYLAREIDNIVSACNRIRDELQSGSDLELDAERIKRFNGEVLYKLDVDEGVVPGAVRTYSVSVAHYRGAPAEDCEYLLERLCTWLASPELSTSEVAPEMRMAHPIVRAILAHLYLARYIPSVMAMAGQQDS